MSTYELSFIREIPGAVCEMKVDEVKYNGVQRNRVEGYLFVFPNVLIYETTSGEDATYIFIVPDRTECFLAFNIKEYFEGESTRKRADILKEGSFSGLIKKFVRLTHEPGGTWEEQLLFYTNRNIKNVIVEEERKCLKETVSKLDLKFPGEMMKIMEQMPFVCQKNKLGIAYNDVCFPAFESDSRFEEVTTDEKGCRLWFGDEIDHEKYHKYLKSGIKMKLCSYGNRFSVSDVTMFLLSVKVLL